MMKDISSKMKVAFEKYLIDEREELTENVLSYIYERINANKDEIEKVMIINKASFSFDELLKTIKEESDYIAQPYGRTIIKDKFMFSQVQVPVGLIAIQTSETLEIIKYWIKAINTRNAVCVSSPSFSETSVEALLLIILKEALYKFEIDNELIQYLPFEECFYEYFDKVIYTHDVDDTILAPIQITEKDFEKSQREKSFVYVECEDLRNEAMHNVESEILSNIDFDTVIKQIDGAKCASIYTKNSELAYSFINLANCGNVFVNTLTENSTDVLISNDLFYKYKNIIVPIKLDLVEDSIIQIQEPSDNLNDTVIEKSLIKDSFWARIIRKFKMFFKK